MTLEFLSKSRGIGNLLARIITVLRRFGISPKKFEKRLKKYYDVMHNAGCLPTFAITAAVLDRHPDYIRELCRRGVEFAVHGYVHIDYGVASREKKREHFKKAISIFNKQGIPFVGFRAPFLRTNADTNPVLHENGFLYNSSRSLYWPVIDINRFSPNLQDNFNRLFDFYKPHRIEDYISLPRFDSGLVEIPVSIPDDEMIIERLGVLDEKIIGDIWLDILENIYERGELFILSLHPERIDHCEMGLREILSRAGEFDPPVWVATLKEIAGWWIEKDRFTFNIEPEGDNRYRVKADCSARATILVKKLDVDRPSEPLFDDYRVIAARDFTVESPVRPVIGLAAGSSVYAVNFLKSEGFIVDTDSRRGSCVLYLDGLKEFTEADEKKLSARIEKSGAPLLRFWRWPDRAKSALSVTGDIDSITLTDFVLRIIENKLKN